MSTCCISRESQHLCLQSIFCFLKFTCYLKAVCHFGDIQLKIHFKIHCVKCITHRSKETESFPPLSNLYLKSPGKLPAMILLWHNPAPEEGCGSSAADPGPAEFGQEASLGCCVHPGISSAISPTALFPKMFVTFSVVNLQEQSGDCASLRKPEDSRCMQRDWKLLVWPASRPQTLLGNVPALESLKPSSSLIITVHSKSTHPGHFLLLGSQGGLAFVNPHEVLGGSTLKLQNACSVLSQSVHQ